MDDDLLQFYQPEHPSFEDNHSVDYQMNWLRLLPAATSDPLCEADDLYSALCAVVDDLYDAIAADIAIVYEGNPWLETEPPRGPITAESIDHKSRASWFRIEDPANRYEVIWGDLDEMSKAESGNSDEVIASEQVDWRIITGLRCD